MGKIGKYQTSLGSAKGGSSFLDLRGERQEIWMAEGLETNLGSSWSRELALNRVMCAGSP